MLELIEWLRDLGGRAGFYGLDLYSLRESMTAVIAYLDTIDAAAAARVRERYGCFDHFEELAYGYATATGEKDPCEDAVVGRLSELRARAAELAARDGRAPRDGGRGTRRDVPVRSLNRFPEWLSDVNAMTFRPVRVSMAR